MVGSLSLMDGEPTLAQAPPKVNSRASYFEVCVDTAVTLFRLRKPLTILSVVLVAMLLAPATAMAAAPATTAPPVEPGGGPAPIPPDLSALTQKMEALTVTSERFSIRTSVTLLGAHIPQGLQQFLNLFASNVSGEAQLSPPAGNFKLTLLGGVLTLRLVQGRTYLYVPALARRDGGRPWVDLGTGGLGSLLGSHGRKAKPTPAPPPTATPFKSLATTLAHPESVIELGGGSVDGQVVTGFRENVDESLLEAQASVGEGATGPASALLASASAHQPDPRSVELETFIAPSGLPVRTRIVVRSKEAASTSLVDIPAIDFPLVVEAPPASQTITASALRKLGRAVAHKRKSRK
jgi:hypothetical protein